MQLFTRCIQGVAVPSALHYYIITSHRHHCTADSAMQDVSSCGGKLSGIPQRGPRDYDPTLSDVDYYTQAITSDKEAGRGNSDIDLSALLLQCCSKAPL